jgi:hypothetical protein
MNYCELIRKIAEDPHVMMSVHLGRDMTVRDMYEIKAHVDNCVDCQVLLDELNEKYPAPEGFYKGDLN